MRARVWVHAIVCVVCVSLFADTFIQQQILQMAADDSGFFLQRQPLSQIPVHTSLEKKRKRVTCECVSVYEGCECEGV